MDHAHARAALERLITERREDYAGLSRLIGRNPAYIQQYIKRGVPRRLAEEDRRKLARYFDVDESVLGGPARAPEPSKDLIAIPRFDIRASAGFGAFTDGETPVAHLGFDERFLKQLSNARPSDLSIIRVRGDSMFPTLADGDDIMVDRSRAGMQVQDGIYVLRRDETLTVKRIAVHPGSRKLTISSDNNAYPSWPDCDPEHVDVIGRVVWAGRRIG
jgi:phage repressor protein C with HTH and peptisase S24 domain